MFHHLIEPAFWASFFYHVLLKWQNKFSICVSLLTISIYLIKKYKIALTCYKFLNELYINQNKFPVFELIIKKSVARIFFFNHFVQRFLVNLWYSVNVIILHKLSHWPSKGITIFIDSIYCTNRILYIN